MSLEFPASKLKENGPARKVEIEPGFKGFIPDAFLQNPIRYFEDEGHNIKTGEIKHDESGKVREDPTAVKILPTWIREDGAVLQTVGKRVNIEKSKVGESGDPFYEYRVMELVASAGLPVPRPIVKVEQQGVYLIVMERARGVGWYEKETRMLKEKGYSDEEIEDLKAQAETMMRELQKRFEEAGFSRGWKLKDMIFDIDIGNKRINAITPTDWERTKVDERKLQEYRAE